MSDLGLCVFAWLAIVSRGLFCSPKEWSPEMSVVYRGWPLPSHHSVSHSRSKAGYMCCLARSQPCWLFKTRCCHLKAVAIKVPLGCGRKRWLNRR